MESMAIAVISDLVSQCVVAAVVAVTVLEEPLPSDPLEPPLEPLPEPSEESSEESPPDGGAAICLGKMRMLKLLATVPAGLTALTEKVKVPVAVPKSFDDMSDFSTSCQAFR